MPFGDFRMGLQLSSMTVFLKVFFQKTERSWIYASLTWQLQLTTSAATMAKEKPCNVKSHVMYSALQAKGKTALLKT